MMWTVSVLDRSVTFNTSASVCHMSEERHTVSKNKETYSVSSYVFNN